MIRLFKVAMAQSLLHSSSLTASPAPNPLLEVLASGYIGQGPVVEEFESALQETLDLPRPPLTTNSCTSALDLALELCGVGPGDYVVTTPMTCTATNGVIVKRHARPVWADVNFQTGLISPESVRRTLKNWPYDRPPKAIMAVDWAGSLPDYDALRSHGIPVIQDAAHSFGAGVGGDYVAWSFQAIKHLTTGDGGALLTPEDKYARAKLLRWYGLDRESFASFRCEQDITEVGFKYHMNDINAAIGLANLPFAVRNLQAHRDNAKAMSEALGAPFDPESSYWFFPFQTAQRDTFIKFAAEWGVEASPVHARNDKHTGFPSAGYPLPGTDYFAEHFVALPCGWWLSPEDVQRVIDTVRAWFNEG